MQQRDLCMQKNVLYKTILGITKKYYISIVTNSIITENVLAKEKKGKQKIRIF